MSGFPIASRFAMHRAKSSQGRVAPPRTAKMFQGRLAPSRKNIMCVIFRPPPCRSLASRLQSPWRTTLNLLCPSSLSPQPKTLKRPPWDAAGASDASFQGNLACLLFGYADGGLNLHVVGTEAPRSRPARMTVDLCAEDARSAKGIVMRGAAGSTRRLGAPRHLPNLT